jgi:hypothetical protein
MDAGRGPTPRPTAPPQRGIRQARRWAYFRIVCFRCLRACVCLRVGSVMSVGAAVETEAVRNARPQGSQAPGPHPNGGDRRELHAGAKRAARRPPARAHARAVARLRHPSRELPSRAAAQREHLSRQSRGAAATARKRRRRRRLRHAHAEHLGHPLRRPPGPFRRGGPDPRGQRLGGPVAPGRHRVRPARDRQHARPAAQPDHGMAGGLRRPRHPSGSRLAALRSPAQRGRGSGPGRAPLRDGRRGRAGDGQAEPPASRRAPGPQLRRLTSASGSRPGSTCRTVPRSRPARGRSAAEGRPPPRSAGLARCSARRGSRW